jgi:hypothetical protein
MGEDVSDGPLIDVRASDLGELIAEYGETRIETALDWLLESNDTCYGFNNFI